MKSLNISNPDAWLEPTWHACVHSFDCNGELVCVVAINLDACAKMDGITVAALLAHEAVHVWQRVRDRLGPQENIGREMEAYAVQNIVGNLMRAYLALCAMK